jgi:hypothetical protein
LVSIASINTVRAKRGTAEVVPETEAEIAETIPEAMHDLVIRLENRAALAAELRTQFRANSTDTINYRGRPKALRRSTAARAGGLQAELEAERSKGFWKRLLGE